MTGSAAQGSGLRRCAIYTRVSSDGGLEQEFNSLHAQREAAEAYIKSQAHEGWRLRCDRYDDGGFSGGSMERPALKKLLVDVGQRRIDVIVVYKVDRLTRSLADFAKLVELFDANGVSFVSVTQSFNTTSSMGRLTLNVLLSFAQFEREVTGERIRDKIAASKKKGIWMGGTVPLGYRVQDRKLLVDEAEERTVRLIFERYLALGSIGALAQDLRDKQIRTRRRTSPSGKVTGGVYLTGGPLSHLLRNRTYLGELNHRGKSYPGDHPAIIDPEVFAAVQAKLQATTIRPAGATGRSGAPLLGRIFDDCGNGMSPSETLKGKIRYRYYVSTALLSGRKPDAGTIGRVPAHAVEKAVQNALREHILADPENHGDLVILSPDLMARVDLRVTIEQRALKVSWIDRAGMDKGVSPSTDDDPEEQTPNAPRRAVTVAMDWTGRKRERAIHLPPDDSGAYVAPLRQKEQQNLIRSVAQAKRWLREIMTGTTVADIASQEGKSERSIRMTLSLAFLDPKLVKAILQGALLRGVSARRLVDAPATWSAQWQAIALSRPS